MAGNVVALGAKRNYCFLDDCVPPDQRTFADCANNQGVSVGCFDDYEPELACQYIDATGVPGIATNAFRVRVTIDPENLLPDANRGNNVTEMVLPGCGDGVVQSGEQCDGGPCCDAACHLMPAGSTCRPAAGPCDVAEVCDGVSPVCPSDANAPDGTSCGPGLPPCSVEECESGACVTQPDTTRGCVIAGACVAPGTADSADACRRCDPSQRSDAWTPIRDPNAHGVACGLARASTVAQTAACPRQTVRAVARRLQRAGGIADALSGARPRQAVRRLLRLVQGTIHLVEASQGCAGGDLDAELQSVRDALRAMAQG